MNTEELYNALLLKDDTGEKAKLLLLQTHWFTVNAIFDPRSGEALPQPLTSFCQKLAFPQSNEGLMQLHDRLWRITEHARYAVEHLIRGLNENPKREHALLPIRAVKELDAVSFIKLSQRPGRNIREKLSGKPYLQAVRRYQSIDLPENRLLKAFAVRLHELLTIRKECLGRVLDEEQDSLLPILDSWLRSDEARSIARWENLPPNNTLLSHRDYRRVWDAWIWLQSLDEDVDKDFSNLERRQQVMTFWKQVAQYRFSTDTIMAELPIVFDYENFIIDTWGGQEIFMIHGNKKRYKLSQKKPLPNVLSAKEDKPQETQIHIPACVDFSSTTPVYSIGKVSAVAPELFVWQKWENEKDSFDLISLNAEAITLDDKVKTVQPKYLFQEHDDIDKSIAEQAAFSFAQKWHKVFCHDTLIWLVPDLLNDFDLEIVRRNINSVFTDAQPLPRSIAAIYQFVDFAKIKGTGFQVIVIDQVGKKLSATKLTARFDPKLKKVVPETYGYAWERHPSEIIENEIGDINGFHTVNTDGTWEFRRKHNPAPKVDEQLKKSLGIGNEYCINLTESPVLGGFKVYKLQCRAGNTPLWYDHLPELSTKIPQNGIFDNFYFVKNARVAPKRGIPVDIPIENTFILPPNLKHYEFPLQRGDGNSTLKFLASLKSSAFPLKSPMSCSLQMTYTYGVDNPYVLTFIPDDNSIRPIVAEWIPFENNMQHIDKLYVPEFPVRKNWTDFECYPKNDGGVSNLLDWITGKISSLDVKEYERQQQQRQIEWKLKKIKENRVEGTICKILRNAKGAFCFVDVDGEDEDIYCSGAPNNIVEDCDLMDFSVGDSVYLDIVETKDGRKYGAYLSFYDEIPDSLILKLQERSQSQPISLDEFLRKNSSQIQKDIFSLRFPILTVWNNGHSLAEADVPNKFRKKMFIGIKNAECLLQNQSTPADLRDELFFFLCCLHKDSPHMVQETLFKLFEEEKDLDNNFRSIAYAIGDASIKWQQDLLNQTLKFIMEDKYNWVTFNILSIVLWRNSAPLHTLSFDILQCLIRRLHDKLKLQPKKLKKLNSDKQYKSAFLCKLIELLLALIRTRSSNNIEIRTLFVPGNPISLAFVDLLDSVTKVIVEENITLKTRISLQVDKPQALNKTPDLLYALRMYLTGDSGANTICIDSISDDE